MSLKRDYSEDINSFFLNEQNKKKRKELKEKFGMKFMKTNENGGSAVSGEDSLQAALREVKEETGIDLNTGNGRMLFKLKRQHHDFPDFVDVWLFEEDIDIAKVILQPNEINDAKWTVPGRIWSMIEKGEFVNVYTYLDKLF